MSNKKPINLKPGMGVDLVFNLSSISPVIKSSIIFDSFENKLIVAQPRIRISPDYKYQTMHISSLITDESFKKKRKGHAGKIVKFIKKFELANGSLTPALEIDYNEPMIDMNIRAAFRFVPSASHSTLGKLLYKGKEYYSGTHFKVFDISISGMGILIPKRVKKERNPLLEIKKNTTAKVGLLLKTIDEIENIMTIESEVQIVRTNPDYNQMSGFAGMKFTRLMPEGEELLNRFIHNGQLFEIRSQNRL